MPAAQIVYEIHSAVWDIELVDTRRRGYRTAKGQLRPCFTFVFAPAASLALAFSLSADPLERQTIVTLLYAVMMQPADQLCGGIPNEVWLYESTASFASSLRRLCEDLGISLRCLTSGPVRQRKRSDSSSGRRMVFLARPTRIDWQDFLGKASARPSRAQGSRTTNGGTGMMSSHPFSFHARER